MTKNVDTWMPLLVDKYLGDTTHLSTEQHGAYLLLLMAMWKRDGSLPNSDAQLAAISRLQPARWKAHREVLLEFFTIDGNTITQKRLSEELTRAKKVTDAKARGGAAGAKKRWHGDGIPNGTANDETDSTAITQPMANGSQNDAPIPIPLPSPSESLNTSGTSYPHPPAVRLNGSHAAGIPKPEDPPECPHQRIRDLWAELMPELQQPVKWTGARATTLRARWREEAAENHWSTEDDGLRFFSKLFRWCRKSDFLMGRAPARSGATPFSLTVPWLIKAENWAKVQEGNYHPEA